MLDSRTMTWQQVSFGEASSGDLPAGKMIFGPLLSLEHAANQVQISAPACQGGKWH